MEQQDNASTAGPRLAFESLLAQLVDRADEVMASHDRLRELIRVTNDLTSNLDLPTVLRRIVEIAVDLVHAKYGALGVLGPDRRLEQFIHVGTEDGLAQHIGLLPQGKGLLGVLNDGPHAVRRDAISEDDRSIGFPRNHPAMSSFLGVPIRVRGELFGNLYLTEHRSGSFSADDEALASALAATAGIAIENARLFEDAVYRERWSTALAATARQLVNDDTEPHLDHLVEQVRTLADADLVTIAHVTLDRDALSVDHAAGIGAESVIGSSFPIKGTVTAQALRSGEPMIFTGSAEPDAHSFDEEALLRHAMVIPFTFNSSTAGMLSVARCPERDPFSARDLELGRSFASHISVSLARADARDAHRKIALMEDRTRIARDLHDHVIQRLFATALTLQAATSTVDPDTTPQLLTAQIAEIDGAITQIRQSIFSLQQDVGSVGTGVRARILEIVDRLQDQLTSRPRVTFHGPVDLMAESDVADDMIAVVNEALSNVVRHAKASSVDISVSAAGGQVSILIVDDGIGPGESPRLSGLRNMRSRAEARGGRFEIEPVPAGGTRVDWTVPSA
ncbi:GAF domain-containing protein [Aeromicrobium sp. P5_D10]